MSGDELLSPIIYIEIRGKSSFLAIKIAKYFANIKQNYWAVFTNYRSGLHKMPVRPALQFVRQFLGLTHHQIDDIISQRDKGVTAMAIGILLKAAAKEKGITLKKIAELSGVSVNTIYDLVKRDPVRTAPDTLLKLAAALEIPVVELLPESQRKRFADLEAQAETEYKKRHLEKSKSSGKASTEKGNTKEHIQLRMLFEEEFLFPLQPIGEALAALPRSKREKNAETLTEALNRGIELFLRDHVFSDDTMEIVNLFLSLNEDGQHQAKKFLEVLAGNPIFTK